MYPGESRTRRGGTAHPEEDRSVSSRREQKKKQTLALFYTPVARKLAHQARKFIGFLAAPPRDVPPERARQRQRDDDESERGHEPTTAAAARLQYLRFPRARAPPDRPNSSWLRRLSAETIRSTSVLLGPEKAAPRLVIHCRARSRAFWHRPRISRAAGSVLSLSASLLILRGHCAPRRSERIVERVISAGCVERGRSAGVVPWERCFCCSRCGGSGAPTFCLWFVGFSLRCGEREIGD